MFSPTALFLIGLIAGGLFGLMLSQRRLGCWSLTLVPIGASSYVGWWQSQHPESLNSTSGLAYFFIQFSPLIGALAGYGLVALIRALRA